MANFPGVQAVQRESVRLGISEYYLDTDVDDIVRAVRKVAAYYS